jgi:hypothetical protein
MNSEFYLHPVMRLCKTGTRASYELRATRTSTGFFGGQSEIAKRHLDGVKATLYDTVAVASVLVAVALPIPPFLSELIYICQYIIINKYICILFIIGKT